MRGKLLGIAIIACLGTTLAADEPKIRKPEWFADLTSFEPGGTAFAWLHVPHPPDAPPSDLRVSLHLPRGVLAKAAIDPADDCSGASRSATVDAEAVDRDAVFLFCLEFNNPVMGRVVAFLDRGETRVVVPSPLFTVKKAGLNPLVVPTATALVGAMFGLIGGVLATVARASLDQRSKTRDMRLELTDRIGKSLFPDLPNQRAMLAEVIGGATPSKFSMAALHKLKTDDGALAFLRAQDHKAIADRIERLHGLANVYNSLVDTDQNEARKAALNLSAELEALYGPRLEVPA